MNQHRGLLRIARRAGVWRLGGLAVFAAALLIWTFDGPADRQHGRLPGSVAGQARVIDGDTLDIAGNRIRLDGIDAPESAQTCTIDGRPYACGQQATAALANLVRGRTVRCVPTDRDRYRRLVARCHVEETEIGINAWMVRHGHAVAYRQYSYRYMPEELLARITSQGLWAGDFQMPWEYRADTREDRVRRS